ncbi:hypothetical protein Clacol_007698 [Clathrus columnatus]|uniref:Uncharacterized protein n=1 Tax=Clathrus columnatus TaxID=1419009 RepID=A0AAV5AK05_9AGAM|nr:hypothetical protein Clacol_007698 [Clathrus columnatus]
MRSDPPQAGLYIIRPKDAPGQALLIGPIERIFPPPTVPVRVGDKLIDRWLLKNAKDNTFNVFAGRGNLNDYKWINKVDNALFVSPDKEPDNFRFESAGNGLVTIGIPSKDLLLTLGDEVPQLTFKPANGSSAQRFELIQILRD